MKKIIFPLLALFLVSCNSAQNTSKKNATPQDFANTISAKQLKTMLYTFASNEMQGRMTGTTGNVKAAEYLRNFYIDHGIASPLADKEDYFQNIPHDYFRNLKDNKPTQNVVAYIKGSEFPDEVIVISAHYDHVGVKNGEVYNGADDDGSGSMALLEIAEAFQEAVKKGYRPKRSILFLHVTGEEIGLYGSKYYTDNPIFPLENTVCDLNIDMIGRIGEGKEGNENYVYLIGSDKLSQELHNLSEEVNKKYTQLELDYTYNDPNDPNRFYYRSDHYNFAKHNVPIIFYFNGVHEDYHQASDTPDKIHYDLLAKRAKLVFLTAWEVANRENRITADKLN